MPIYTYKCKECNHNFEVRCSIEERNKDKPCPLCAKPAQRIKIDKANMAIEINGVECSASQGKWHEHPRS